MRRAHIRAGDVVVEVGAGTGILTRALASRARLVIALEVDPLLARRLQRTFATDPRVSVVAGDALAFTTPTGPWRAFGNIPFHITTRLLRRLLEDRTGSPTRADLIVQWEVARKRSRAAPGTLLSRSWGPWWRFSFGGRIPAACFIPPPSVDAALLTITRRAAPLLPETERAPYEAFLRSSFAQPAGTIKSALRPVASARLIKRLARELGFAPDAHVVDLSLGQWVDLYRSTR